MADGRAFTSRQDCIADFPVEERLQIGADGLLPRSSIDAIVRAVDGIEGYGDVADFVKLASGAGARPAVRRRRRSRHHRRRRA